LNDGSVNVVHPPFLQSSLLCGWCGAGPTAIPVGLEPVGTVNGDTGFRRPRLSIENCDTVLSIPLVTKACRPSGAMASSWGRFPLVTSAGDFGVSCPVAGSMENCDTVVPDPSAVFGL
jgi:hypothetical protein